MKTTDGVTGSMARRKRGKVIKEAKYGLNPRVVAEDRTVILAERDWDSDELDPYTMAVDTILEALEGLWFDTDDFQLETQVNQHVQSLKQKIQGML